MRSVSKKNGEAGESLKNDALGQGVMGMHLGVGRFGPITFPGESEGAGGGGAGVSGPMQGKFHRRGRRRRLELAAAPLPCGGAAEQETAVAGANFT